MSGSLASLMMGQEQPLAQATRIPLSSMTVNPLASTAPVGLMAMLGDSSPQPVPVMAPDDPNRVTMGDAYTSTKNTLGDWIAAQRADAAARGLWNNQTGLPTQAGVANAMQQYGGALMAGTSTPESKGPTLDDVRNTWDGLGINHSISENGGTITLSKIVVPQDARNKGIGTQAMQQLADYADATGKRIVLTPDKSFGATSISRLTDFYRGLGFSANKGRSRDFTTKESMIRDPQTPDGSQ